MTLVDLECASTLVVSAGFVYALYLDEVKKKYVLYDKVTEFCSENDQNYPKLRSTEEHAMHTLSVATDKTLVPVYGVCRPGALQSSKSFSSTLPLPPDCMNDLLQGVIPAVLKVCLRGLLAYKIMTLCVFNERLQHFKFGKNDSKNMPVILSPQFEKNGLPGSAS